MFSEKIYADIAKVTRKALEEIHSVKVIDRVTVIREYVQLSLRHPVDGDARLRNSIERLAELARGENRQSLIAALNALVQAMNQECAPRSLAARA